MVSHISTFGSPFLLYKTFLRHIFPTSNGIARASPFFMDASPPMTIAPSIRSTIHPSVDQCLSVCLPVFLSFCLSVHLFVRLTVHPSIYASLYYAYYASVCACISTLCPSIHAFVAFSSQRRYQVWLSRLRRQQMIPTPQQ